MAELTTKTTDSFSDHWYRPIKTRRRRRLFVAFMYISLLFIFVGILANSINDKPVPWTILLALLVALPPALGGSRYFGPVKKFENPRADTEPGYVLFRSMNPTLWKKRGMPAWANDEFDIQRRNQAHYSAYRTLRWIYPVLAAGLWFLSRNSVTSAWAVRVLEALLLPSLVAFWWLPQAIILWTEEDWKEESADGPQLVGDPRL